jgi:DNA helicase-2/ATP-dependent DNA helicase PcrA
VDSLLEGLTPAQRQAVEHIEGPLLILAGPGSGKTRVVTHRVAYLLRNGVMDRQILALTFTNKAADEMRARIARLAPGADVWVGTFHRFCSRILRKYASMLGFEPNFTIFDSDEASRAVRRVVERLRIDLTHATPDAIQAAISWAKNKLIGPDVYEPRTGNPLGDIVKRVYPAYQAQLAKMNAVDFDDLLMHVVSLLRDNPEVRASLDERHRFVLVDEYQDTNLPQYAIARALSIDHPNLAVTGDPDQSIYGWRGANLNNILDFEKDFPSVRIVRLEQNYRSTKRILKVAAGLITHNVKRKQKDLYTDNDEGAPVRLATYANQKDEAREIAGRIADEIHEGRRRPRDFAVFYRINALSLPFEMALREQGVPYQVVSGYEFFQRREIKDILSFLRVLNNPRDDLAMLRAIGSSSRGIGKTTLGRVSDYSAAHGLSLWEGLRDCQQIEGIRKNTSKQILAFVEILDRLVAVAGGPIEEFLGHVFESTGYRRQFEGSEDPVDSERLANLEELLTVAREFDERCHEDRRLEQFLEETSLVSDTDDWDADNDRVTLMTLHASKGLEFPVVFLVAVEQGLLPHERSREQMDQLEEERRLMFVGITRAKQELQISMARCRDFRGQRRLTIPSQFLLELPREAMELCESAETQDESLYVHTESPTAPQPGPLTPRSSEFPSLTTAAEMNGVASRGPVSPDDFAQGMLVRHPEYGIGRIVALSGGGAMRKATVDFLSRPARRAQFVLSKSPLRPVKPTSRGD